jgi:hypothetical protein
MGHPVGLGQAHGQRRGALGRLGVHPPQRPATFNGGAECACTTIDVSPEGIAVLALGHSADVGEHVIAYFRHMGRVEGTVVRIFDRGFVIKLAAKTQGRLTLVRKIAATMRRRRDSTRADRSNGEAERSRQRAAPMSREEFDNLTAVVRGLLERSAS